MPTLNLLIQGRVQGVFYRATAKEKAEKLSLTGWIRNSTGGNVEAVVTGTEEQLQAFISWCKHGPKRAEVSDVIVTLIKDTTFKDFKIVR